MGSRLRSPRLSRRVHTSCQVPAVVEEGTAQRVPLQPTVLENLTRWQKAVPTERAASIGSQSRRPMNKDMRCSSLSGDSLILLQLLDHQRLYFLTHSESRFSFFLSNDKRLEVKEMVNVITSDCALGNTPPMFCRPESNESFLLKSVQLYSC